MMASTVCSTNVSLKSCRRRRCSAVSPPGPSSLLSLHKLELETRGVFIRGAFGSEGEEIAERGAERARLITNVNFVHVLAESVWHLSQLHSKPHPLVHLSVLFGVPLTKASHVYW